MTLHTHQRDLGPDLGPDGVISPVQNPVQNHHRDLGPHPVRDPLRSDLVPSPPPLRGTRSLKGSPADPKNTRPRPAHRDAVKTPGRGGGP